MDVFLPPNGDLGLTQNGDIQVATGRDEVVQRIERRCITAARGFWNGMALPPDYLGDANFGLGLGRDVEGTFTSQQITALETLIKAGIMQDAEVDTTFLPEITFSQPSINELDFVANFNLVSGDDISIQFTLGPEVS